MEDKLVDLMDMARTLALCTIENEGDITATFMAELPFQTEGKNSVMVIQTPWADDVEKSIMLKILTAKFAHEKVVRYAFISTAWSASYDPKESPIGERPKIMPKERPDRQEILLLLAVEPGRPPLFEERLVTRVSDTEATVGEPVHHSGIRREGRMFELLGPIVRAQ